MRVIIEIGKGLTNKEKFELMIKLALDSSEIWSR